MTKKVSATMDWISRIGVPILLAIMTFLLNTAAQELRDLRSDIRSLRIETQSKFEKLQIENAILQEKLQTHLKVNL